MINDSERLDFLERNLLQLYNSKNIPNECDIPIIFGQIKNEARKSDGDPEVLIVKNKSIREAIDHAINWKKTNDK